MPSVEAERVVSLRSSPERLWPLLTDTERLNRAMGQERVSYTPLDGDSAARFLGRTRLGGLEVEYEERPTQWERPRFFHIQRHMKRGPAEQLDFRIELAPEGSGTRVRLWSALQLKSGLLVPIARPQLKRQLERLAESHQQLDAALQAEQPAALASEAPVLVQEALAQAEARLRQASPGPAADKLLALVRTAPDTEVTRIRPYELAEGWGLDRREVLTAALAATRAGLLDMRWEVVCPSCQTGVGEAPSLDRLADHGVCQLCEIQFGLDADEGVEAVFAPSASVRRVDHGPYCIAGPARVPHVLAQAVVPAGASVELHAPAEAGRYRVFLRGGRTWPLEVAEGAPAELALPALAPEAAPQVARVGPGAALRVPNPEAKERHAKLERLRFGQFAATLRELATLPNYRRDFSRDLLRQGVSLRVGRAALLFTDLTGSTELYSKVGDAAAFKLVHDHFDLVQQIIERHRGTVVKTIGDAVMAAFETEAEAVAASLEVLSSFEAFRQAGEHRALTHIKLGVYAGPCYLVSANGVLDYFGQSVNVAARLQGLAQSGELVVPAELWERVAPASGASVLERFSAKLKGVASPIEAVRVAASAQAQPQPAKVG